MRHLNAHHDAVGSVTASDGVTRPALWTGLVRLRILPTPAGYDAGEAVAITDDGLVYGDVSNSVTGAQQAWQWSLGGRSRPLGFDYGNQTGYAGATVVSNEGDVGGYLDFGGQAGLWAAVWHHGVAQKLGQIGSDLNFSVVYGGDNSSDYTGIATYEPDFVYGLHAFVTHVGLHKLLTLMPLSGNALDPSNAHAVQRDVPGYGSGVTVGGESATPDGDVHATVWTCALQQGFTPPQASPATPLAIGSRNAALGRSPMVVSSIDADRGRMLGGPNG